MCGIAGIVAQNGQRADLAAVQRMVSVVAHRGPDGDGTWRSRDGRVALAHRRLAIIDLHERARQPMVGINGDVAISYNGEIYNHAELRRRLMAAGHRFQTDSSDTEVLIEGYRAWGIDGLLSRIDGIYAFALHDVVADVTHLVRDRYGIKPLYVAWIDRRDGGSELSFASEMRAIAAHPLFRAKVDRRQIARYLTFMSAPAPATLLEGIWKVPAGCRLVVTSDGRAALVRFGGEVVPATAAGSAGSRSAIVAEIRATFGKVVEAQLVADVPVGVMLSGGLDSGATLALASRRRPGVCAYTVAFTDDPASDETALAAATARRCRAQHRILQLHPQEVVEHVDEVIGAMDEPQADWVCVPLWFLARDVAASGLKAALVGEGADELFAGYEHWRRYLGPIARIYSIARAAGPFSVLGARMLAALSPASNIGRLVRADFLARAGRRDELFWGGAILCWPAVLAALWRPAAVLPDDGRRPRWSCAANDDGPSPHESPAECVRHWYRSIDRACPGAHALDRMIAIEFRQRLPELLLMRVDKITMAHGVEARVPFLARAMVDLACKIPAAEKLAGSGTKALLREAFADLLPPAVLGARKRGFGAPVHRWLRGPFGSRVLREIADGPLGGTLAPGVVEDLARDHASGRADHAGILWALFVLSRWVSISGARTDR
ncbi:MAG: asparagine synthase (glutamine-hydrolyzing) [Hyphomicrobiaceae bacterium]